ncbi:MXRA5 [Branchiostoma lanceolatum]|uniref:MXRA5 protein n=1 Tax=Branchiostoma lanceolatum TaxID=7740 RepID=A0A8K0EKQ2_BRALA|nr:MXRA5 [Branchiostoma lanceolatum]
MLTRLYPTFAEGHRRMPKPKPVEPSLVAHRVEGCKSALMAHRALTIYQNAGEGHILDSRADMEKRNRQCVAILVLLVLKFSLPCPEECFVQRQFGMMKNCQCPVRQIDKSFLMSCVSHGLTVATNSVCSAENDGLTCLNDAPTGFDQSVTGILLNRLFNLTTLTKQHIPPLPNLITFVITGSTIQAIEADSFSSVPSIKSVTIKCSRLHYIGDFTFYNLPSLKTINLKHNLIETVSPRAFFGLNSLCALDVEGNQLKSVPFETLSLIRHSTTVAWLDVYLGNNQISTVLETNWKKIVDTRLTILLQGNPLYCDGRIRWLVCNAKSSALGVNFQADHLQCTSPTELTGYDFQSLYTDSSTELRSSTITMMTSTFPTAEPTTLPTKLLKTTNFTLTKQSRKSTSDTEDSTRSFVLGINLDDGQQIRMDYLYIPFGLTFAVIALIGGTTVVMMIYKRFSKIRHNLVHRLHGVIISSQLVSNQMYQHSGSATGDANDTAEIEDETEEDSTRQNPAQKRQRVTINTSELISNRLHKFSGSAINNASKDTETTEETEQDSELTPYLTVPFDAINNTLRIEPYSSVNLNDISNDLTNVASGGISVSHGSREVQHDDDMEPYAATSLDQIGYL